MVELKFTGKDYYDVDTLIRAYAADKLNMVMKIRQPKGRPKFTTEQHLGISTTPSVPQRLTQEL
jgi:predicted alpha-1,6-mannanase (GH76 family)